MRLRPTSRSASKPKEKASPDNSIDSHALGEFQHDRAAPYQRQGNASASLGALSPLLSRLPLLPLAPDRVHVLTRRSCIDACGARQGFRPQFTLIAIPDQPDTVKIDSTMALRHILGELVAEHDHVVLVAEPGFGSMKRCDVSSNARAGAFDESQFVPILASVNSSRSLSR